jgi:AcrR family transcriptional regulator
MTSIGTTDNSVERGSSEQRCSELRVVIVEVAAHLFADKGYAATSMRAVAEAADCTKPALYYYFDSKSALFLEVIESRTDAINSILETAFQGEGTVRERLVRAAEAIFDYVRNDPEAMKVLIRSELHADSGQPSFDFKSSRATITSRARTLLEEGVESGEIGEHVGLDDALYALMGIIDIRCMLWVLQGEPIPDDCGAKSLDLIFGGIAP